MQNRRRESRGRRAGAFVYTVAWLLVAVAGPVGAQSRWTNYLDASIIREIIHRDGDLYLATSGGLLVYHVAAGTFDSYDNIDGLPSNDLTTMVFDASGAMYIGTADIGIAKATLSGGRLSVLRALNEQIDGLADNTINSIAVWGDDVVYGSAGGAGLVVNDFPAALYRVGDGLPSNTVEDVFPVGDVVWMATAAGIAAVDGLGIVRRPSGGPAAAHAVGSDGQLVWFGTDGGAWTLDPSDSTWSQVGPAEPIHSFHFDGATMRAGGTRSFWEHLGGSNWQQRNVSPIYGKYNLNGDESDMHALLALSDDDIYIGAGQLDIRKGINLVHWDGQGFADVLPNAPGASDVRRLSVDLDGSVWAAFSSFFVGKLTPRGTWVNYNSTIPESDSLSNQFQNLTCLADSDGYKWFSTLSSVAQPIPLDRLDDKLDDDYTNDGWVHLTVGSGGGDGLGSLRLQRALEDPAGNRWFLSDAVFAADGWQGIHILSRDQSQWLQVKPGDSPLASGNVQDIAFANGFVYVALTTVGIQKWTHGGYDWANLSNLDDDSWQNTWTVPNAGELVANIEYRSDGALWIGTDFGVYRFLSGITDHIGAFDGFGAGLLSIQVWDILLDHAENLWVATPLGLNRISREDEDDIDAYSTPAAFQSDLNQRQYPFDVISPLVDARCQVLALHPQDDVLYVGTRGGLSVFDFSPAPAAETSLARVYVYPNPLYGRLGHQSLKIENVTTPVSVDIYTMEGELVHSQTAVESGEEVWDLTTAAGFVAASGVYVVRISAGSTSVVKAISVIR